MALDADDVHAIAHLARLALDAGQVGVLAGELSQTLGLLEQINAADTAGVAPMAHPLDMTQRLRADEVTEQVDREAFLAQAPASEAGLFLVPRVLD
ncbi:MAG: Asp-tRNA(Asn)/Glu-tRNA(Gln) amidotransferase subunit GatC [Pseudomonadota bacterium]|nr:Asp-tRNA(Asn)/Glu-tRNA(Gln) amidotransferase subunit GatC [Pseudomonadota bacterium]HJO35816.1 Asp-tRNA(Asn)/Glu-tRNA(Gln) amidotransferase subunit GatC [Gammaproteobacteria bacterium]